jgi:hypothetical protein
VNEKGSPGLVMMILGNKKTICEEAGSIQKIVNRIYTVDLSNIKKKIIHSIDESH